MSNNFNSDIWEEFTKHPTNQKIIEKVDGKKRVKEAQAFSSGNDRSGYEVDPGNNTTLSQSTTTQGVNAGGASLVGNEDRAIVYDNVTSPAACQGGAEKYADPVVEGLEDVASAMMEVATKAPTGNPEGSQDNTAEKWDGIPAVGSKRKSFTKQADVDEIIKELEEEDTVTAGRFSTLKDLVKLADFCDQQGEVEDANEIDLVLKEEVKHLIEASKKK